ncbi:DDE-1 domain-containing protein [Trichonephila clavipes]|nr:DDE-1 domain-containing protein [Trichonephila clavipes]
MQGSLVVRASDSRPEGLGSMLDVTKYPPSAHGFTCRNCGGGDRGRVAIYRPFGEVSLSLNRTVTCMVLKANDRRTSCPCHDEFRGPRSDYVRQLSQYSIGQIFSIPFSGSKKSNLVFFYTCDESVRNLSTNILRRLFGKAPPGSAQPGFTVVKTAGVIRVHFSLFLNHFYLHVKPSKEYPALLIIGNHKTHITLQAILYCTEKNIIIVRLPPHTSHRPQPLDVSFFGPFKTYYSQACDNFMVIHPGQTIADKNIGEILSTDYFKAATAGNAVKGFKECGSSIIILMCSANMTLLLQKH